MSHHCQFCDKEMVFELSVVYQNEYVTCGSEECTDKAFANAKFHYDDARRLEMDVIVFNSRTPDDPNSWKAVLEKDYPQELHDYDIMAKMLEGTSIYLEDPKSHYTAMLVKDFRKILSNEIKQDNKASK